MKNTPGGSFPRGGFPGAAFGARDRSLGRSIGGWLPVSCPGTEAFRCLSLILLWNLLFPPTRVIHVTAGRGAWRRWVLPHLCHNPHRSPPWCPATPASVSCDFLAPDLVTAASLRMLVHL